jgi:hypothetical protein
MTEKAVVLTRNQQKGGARLEPATLGSSTVRETSSWADRHSRAGGGRILGVLEAEIHGRFPKWQNSQQCETLCSCIPQASIRETSNVHVRTTHASTVRDVEAGRGAIRIRQRLYQRGG